MKRSLMYGFIFNRDIPILKLLRNPIYWCAARIRMIKAGRNPQTFNEKLLRRMLVDRRKVLTTFADKHAARIFVESRVGANITPELYQVWNSPTEINLSNLPRNFVVKPSHGSGAMIMVWDGALAESELPKDLRNVKWERFIIRPEKLDPQLFSNLVAHWFTLNYYKDSRFYEWAYKKVPPRVLVEEMLFDDEGNIPDDYKFFMMDGKCSMIQLDESRFLDHHKNLYDSAWNLLPCRSKYPASEYAVEPPSKLTEMIALAEKISTGVDFLRVDLYQTNHGVKFGETTNYPNAGGEFFHPIEFDFWLGKTWKNMQSLTTPLRKILTFLFPALFIAICLVIKTQWPGRYTSLIAEDSFFEDLQFLFYFSGCVVAALCAGIHFNLGKRYAAIFYAVISLALFFISGEEISWGQRLFAINTPVFFQRNNAQDEISLHNLGYLQSKLANGYIVIGIVGALLWLLLKWLDPKEKFVQRTFMPEWYLTLYFLFPGIIYLYFQLSQFLVKETGDTFFEINTFFVWRDQEPAETLLSLGALLFLSISLRRLYLLRQVSK